MGSHSSKKVLVTGANGFTGYHLVRALHFRGYEVVEVVNSASNKNHVCADIRNKETIQALLAKHSPEYVVHLAAISFVGHKDNLAFYDINVLGTQNLLDAILDSGIPRPRVLIASSANVYGALEKELILESDICKPINHYAISKLAMEEIVTTYFNKLDILITRPFNYTGVNQAIHFLVPKIVDHFKRHKSIIELGNIDVARDYSSVDFVVEAYIRLLESNVSSEVINVCSGHLTTLKQIIEMMQQISGHSIEVRVNPDFVRENEIKVMSGSNDKLFQTIGNITIDPFRVVLNTMYSR
ncbi:NAD-dependent epimerase/dehydratase family protein [Gynuella sp.]|uniref:NAD-dependent epimerase/dehydratase family protein n=1 Tax=Gynuella sp. TaxID=2969146 RepID=UPI003D09F927